MKNMEIRRVESRFRSGRRKALCFFIGVAVLWLLCTLIVYLLLPDWQTRGTAGDSFGAVNALFSGLAFAGVIYALNLQRKQLEDQEEMKATRRVTEAQQEMRTGRQFIAQPLPIPVESLAIDRLDTHHRTIAIARSHAISSMLPLNPTQYP